MARGFWAALLGLCLSSSAAFGEPLKIGVLTDMSGVIADTVGRGSVVAAALAVSDAGGSVLGRPIEIVSADHQLKPDVGLTIARRWFDEEHVEAIADIPVSTIALGIQNLARSKGKIALISGSGTLDLFGKSCSPTGFVWTFDTNVLPRATVLTGAQSGVKKWFAVGPDYSFGHQMERAVADAVSETGGQLVGSRRTAIGTSDYASLLLAAQEAQPDAIASSFAGHDGVLLIENAVEFGLLQKGIRIAGLMLFEADVHSLGLERMQGIYTTTAFYWDTDDNTRSFAKRFSEKMGRPPSALQAGVYSSITHYLKAVKAAGTASGPEVAKKMHELPISDLTTPSARIRADGRVMRDMFLVQVKSPAESKGPWDYFKIVRRMKPEELMSETPSPDCKLEN
ncbi:Branched chain amino acid transport system substrate-binding protein [Bradyrhizobium sp. STM 3843]|uniref:ABC transporter substrate-binding protein n=1 Tax=Bradyrhizobium sp. STM 3843 TaxID=551947 RepID=UPI0002404366|nr:ABC transporter substrate-binding protein [Bradyrhizobium sp. STM 3843]CCE09791.1 Branched chain amino acid transport system substrate-binding protein [Bradyrhizobium sp. STM 3843]